MRLEGSGEVSCIERCNHAVLKMGLNFANSTADHRFNMNQHLQDFSNLRFKGVPELVEQDKYTV